MNYGLSGEVRQALQDIYYNERTGRGSEAFALLQKASDAGDGDASCVLARCLCGFRYVWKGHGFVEDHERAVKLLHKSVEQGSALGVLTALQYGEDMVSGEESACSPDLSQAFDSVLKMAEEGEAFCQYMIGNTYFWQDFLKIQNKNRDSFENGASYREYLRENISKCEDWFWKAFKGGIYFAANNLNHYYTKGSADIIAPRPEKAKKLWKIGAEAGHPIHQYIYAGELQKENRSEEALYWFMQAADGGHPGAWSNVGYCYAEGIGTEKDENFAIQCYEKGMRSGDISCHNRLGRVFLLGLGVPTDYEKAFKLLSFAYNEGSRWGVFYLAKCYFYGWGTQQDYTQARRFLEEMKQSDSEADYLLGMIYGHGLGTGKDTAKAAEYLQRAGDYEEAKQELLNYKKTFLGKWVRR